MGMRFLLLMTLFTSSAVGQVSRTDSGNLQQQTLDELRAIHRDLRASTTLQLLLAELQITQTSLDRATQKRDALKAQVTDLQAGKSSAQADLARFEAGMQKVANPDQQFIDRLDELKVGLRRITAQEAATSEQLEDAEGRLRSAQAERDYIQGQLSDLVKKLGALN